MQKISFKKLFKWSFLLAVFVAILIIISNYWIIRSTKDRLYSDVEAIPANDVAILLGTSKNLLNGSENLFFKYRIEAAAKLFKAGKIKHIIVSGDNRKKEYDETTDMRNSLIALGVPDSCITDDYAGFRTLDSMVRCLKVFGQKNITVISQEFHNQRALFIGDYYDMDVVAFNAKDVPQQYSLKTRTREHFAKFKAVLDLYVFHTQPKFLGEEIKINL
ncbi:MAG TPA: ElyC/SanA/YdcF family protein [Bacteroidia bacterium]|jgi:SanA protein